MSSRYKSRYANIISGRMRVKMDDGFEEEFNLGGIGYVSPGHNMDNWERTVRGNGLYRYEGIRQEAID